MQDAVSFIKSINNKIMEDEMNQIKEKYSLKNKSYQNILLSTKPIISLEENNLSRDEAEQLEQWTNLEIGDLIFNSEKDD